MDKKITKFLRITGINKGEGRLISISVGYAFLVGLTQVSLVSFTIVDILFYTQSKGVFLTQESLISFLALFLSV